MFLRELSEKELNLFFKFTALVHAIDRPSVELVPSILVSNLQEEIDELTKQYNLLKKEIAPINTSKTKSLLSALSMKKEFEQENIKQHLISIQQECNTKIANLKKLEAAECATGFNINQYNYLINYLRNISNENNISVIDTIITLVYNDYNSLLLSMFEDVDDDIPNSSESEYRFIYATKLSKRYFKESEVIDSKSGNIINQLPESKLLIIYELYSISLLNSNTIEMTALQDRIIKKIANILEIDEAVEPLKKLVKSAKTTQLAAEKIIFKEKNERLAKLNNN